MTSPQAEGRVAGMPSMEERLARSAKAVAIARTCKPACPHWGWITPPDADAAVRGLVAGLLSDDELSFIAKGHRRFAREERRDVARRGGVL